MIRPGLTAALIVFSFTHALGAPGDIATIAGGLGEGPALTVGQGARGIYHAGGKLYVADADNGLVRAIDLATGLETVVAGSIISGYAGDGGPALGARLHTPFYVAVDAAGNLFVDDQNNYRIRRVDAVTGIIETIVGDGEYGYAGDGGPGTSARFAAAYGMVTDSSGNLFFCDVNNGRIRRWDALTHVVDTVANVGGYPWGLAIDASDNLYFGNELTVFKADAGTYAVTELGTVAPGPGQTITGVAVDSAGNVYASSHNLGQVFRIDAVTHAVTPYAGGGGFTPSWGDGGPATAAFLPSAWSVAVDADDNVLIAGERIRKVDAATQIISTIAGTGNARWGGDGGPAVNAQIYATTGIAVDAQGRVYLAGGARPGVRRVDLDGTISTIAGGGEIDGDGFPATDTYLDPSAILIDPAGNLLLAEPGPGRIRRIDAVTGLVSTIAGGNDCGPTGDGGLATAAQLCDPNALALDAAGNLYIGEDGNASVRRVDKVTGIITTVAGTLGDSNGPLGDGGPATSAALQSPRGVAVDALGRIWIAESGGHRIRRVSTAGIITTVAGTGVPGYNGDDIPAASAQLGTPYSIAFDLGGSLFVADSDNNRIRRIDPAGTIHTLAGTGSAGYSGDGGPATAATLFAPIAAVAHPSGSVYVLDQNTQRVRRISSLTCGDGILSPGEQCDDGNAVDDDVCSNLCRIDPSTVSEPAAAPSQQVSTGSVATPADPIQAAVTLPGTTGGSVEITKAPDGALTGISVLSGLISIHVTPDSPPTPSNPLVLEFVIDAALVPPGELVVTKDGSVVPACTTPGSLSPSPSCVSTRTTLPAGDLVITVLTLSASDWTVGDVCGPVPASGCKQGPTGKSVLLLKNHPSDPAKDLLTWTWSNGAATTLADLAAPLNRTPYSVCIYDDAGLKLQATALAGGNDCGGATPKACWKQTPTGYGYADKALTPDGLQSISLKAGAQGKSKIVVKGRGVALGMPGLPLSPRIRAQIKVGAGAEARCWEASFSTLLRSAKPAEAMKAKSD
jgi:cysteine-rich repeat protein